MRIGLDVSAALSRHPTGVSRAVRGLIQGFATEATLDDEFVLFARPSRWRPWRPVPLPGGRPFRRRFYRDVLPPRTVRRLDVFHGLDSRLPVADGLPRIATIHDLSALQDGGFTTDEFRERRLGHWHTAIDRAWRIVTYSEHVRQELVGRLSVAPERVEVVPLGVGDPFRPRSPEEVAGMRERHGLPERFVLSPGGCSRRKGTVPLLEAFARIAAPEVHLVICGRDGHGADEVPEAIERLELGERVRRLGYIPRDEAVAALLTAAAVCVLPALYEGFGLSALEAMACGTPVVATEAGGQTEVVGDAARRCPPGDVDALARALAEVLGDPRLRAVLVRRGIDRAWEFPWSRTAAATLELYRRAVE